MTSTESVQLVKRVNESAKKSPLKVVSPIIKKYSGHRQGKIKKKLKFPRILHGGRSTRKRQIKPQLKTILPKTNADEVIILEPELFPCALNPQKKLKEEENELGNESSNEQGSDGKTPENSPAKDLTNKIYKGKLLPINKKKIKCLKNIEASLELLESNASALKEKREQAFVENYLSRVQQRLKGNEESIYNQFLELISNFQTNGLSVCDMYKKVRTLFHSHLDLCEDFVAFLTPEQAVECGVFMDHLLLTTMSDFLNMIDIYFSKSPQQIRKIHSVLESLATKSNITSEYVMDSVLPLLKGNPVLRDYFLRLLPSGRPPDNLLTDFEEVEYPELNSDVSDEEETVETVHLPEIEDPYGGDFCPCKCHEVEGEKFRSRNEHCISCSLKFINGKIFIQQGKLLKPARVVFDDHDMSYHRERLTPKLYPKRSRKRHRHTLLKDNLSPTKSCNLSSDEFKSDIEDEERGRLKLLSSKSPRLIWKKSLSPKNCDKNLPRCILNDLKAETEPETNKCIINKCLDSVSRDEKLTNETKTEGEEVSTDVVCEVVKDICDDKEQISFESSENLHLSMVSLNDSFKSEENDTIAQKESSVLKNKERSLSPPVLSIPETATPLFSEVKPILLFLEKLESKESDSNEAKTEESSDTVVKTDNVKMEESKQEENPWKIEEDRVILQTLQLEENSEETFVKIGKNIPGRSVDDIKKRFEELMNIFYEMKARTGNT